MLAAWSCGSTTLPSLARSLCESRFSKLKLLLLVPDALPCDLIATPLAAGWCLFIREDQAVAFESEIADQFRCSEAKSPLPVDESLGSLSHAPRSCRNRRRIHRKSEVSLCRSVFPD
jgi:hypothetical protein